MDHTRFIDTNTPSPGHFIYYKQRKRRVSNTTDAVHDETSGTLYLYLKEEKIS